MKHIFLVLSILPSLALSADLPEKTTITPSLDIPHQKNQNLIWCGTFQLAWNAFAAAFCNGPMQLEGSPQIEKSLNAAKFSERSIDAESIYIKTARMSPKLLDEIAAELRKRFGENALPPPKPPRETGTVAYAFLYKSLSFRKPFNTLKMDWTDDAGATSTQSSFGLDPVTPETPAELRNQINIFHEDQKKNEYIIELKNTSARDRIILALVDPAATFKDTVAAVEKRVNNPEHVPFPIALSDRCVIPSIRLSVERVFDELRGLRILNAKIPEATLVCDARQRIAFNLNEKGAELKSDSLFGGMKNGHDPRHIKFNRPFLLLLQRSGVQEPYLAV